MDLRAVDQQMEPDLGVGQDETGHHVADPGGSPRRGTSETCAGPADRGTAPRRRWRSPGGIPVAASLTTFPPLRSTRRPRSAPAGRVTRDTRATAAMLGSASPRKPRVPTSSRSWALVILLVAWRWKASSTSSAGMPQPSSVTRTSSLPPPATSTVMWAAPASREFSTSSLTTREGRSATSPAAILPATSGASTLMDTVAGDPFSNRRSPSRSPGPGQKRGTVVPLARNCLSSEAPVATKSEMMP